MNRMGKTLTLFVGMVGIVSMSLTAVSCGKKDDKATAEKVSKGNSEAGDKKAAEEGDAKKVAKGGDDKAAAAGGDKKVAKGGDVKAVAGDPAGASAKPAVVKPGTAKPAAAAAAAAAGTAPAASTAPAAGTAPAAAGTAPAAAAAAAAAGTKAGPIAADAGAKTVTSLSGDGYEATIARAIVAAMNPDEPAGWELYQKELHSQELFAQRLKSIRRFNWPYMRRKVKLYLADDAKPEFKIVRVQKISDDTVKVFVHNEKSMPTPCFLKKDAKVKGAFRITNCSL